MKENKVKKFFVLSSILAVILIGCGEARESEATKRQFIEIISQDNQLIGIMEEPKSIEEFTKKLDIESWEYCDDIEKDAKLICTYIGYEVVDDSFYLKGKDPYMIKDSMELYRLGEDYYVVDYTEDSKDIAKVTKATGKYLSELGKLNINKEIKAEDIIDKWKAELGNLKDSTDNQEVEDKSSDEVDKITESDVRSVSKEQRLDILDNKEQEVLYSTSEISEITNYLNTLSENEWEEVQAIKDTASVERNIIRYELARKTSNRELVESSRIILYKDKEDYYCEEIIPNNGKQKEDYNTYYKIPKEIGEYICSLSSNQ